MAAGTTVEIKDKVELQVPGTLPSRLSPDGRSVLYVERLGEKGYGYTRVGIDGKNKKVLLTSAVDSNNMFALCFGTGVLSPDGERFAALTTHDGTSVRDGGKLMMVIVDGRGKAEPLPTESGQTLGAVFALDGTVWYVDGFPDRRSRDTFKGCALRRRLPSGNVETVLKTDGLLTGLTVSPDGRCLGGILMAEEGIRFWVYDIASGKAIASEPVKMEDFHYGARRVFWSSDSKALYANGRKVPKRGKQPFSILRFEPVVPSRIKPTAEALRRYEKWILELGAEDFQVRKAATRYLRQAGPAAILLLQKAARSSDPEVSTRARGILSAQG